jgi:hypothetical protein
MCWFQRQIQQGLVAGPSLAAAVTYCTLATGQLLRSGRCCLTRSPLQMVFAGMKKPKDRASLIAFLKTATA